jgi:YHS domain-containing protein
MMKVLTAAAVAVLLGSPVLLRGGEQAMAANTVVATETGPRVATDDNGVALSGYDPLSYFAGKPAAGDSAITAVHEGAIYRFTSAEHRDRFNEDPQAFSPQFGGYCAFGVTKDAKFEIDPMVYRVVDGKLYLNKDADVMKLWVQDVPGNIKIAVQKWPGVQDKPVAK